MITGNYVYVDKTELIYNLFSGGRRLFFLSRPRRFGKSLFISLLKELFSGNKQLFTETWIGKQGIYNWQEYPVIQLDFSHLSTKNAQEFEESLKRSLDLIGKKFDIDVSYEDLLTIKLQILVQNLAQKNKVVILIDEYDSALLSNINNLIVADEIQKIMRNFFSAIKSLDAFGYVHVIFITGVTKFAKTSIFSGMNNLNDISLKEETAQLLGYTQEELIRYFGDHIQTLAAKHHSSVDEILDTMKTWYNGYQFSEYLLKVYNPFSILCYLSNQKLANYWFKSGTPTFLIHLIKKQYPELDVLPIAALKPEHLETFELNNIPLIPLLFQTGYLTISEYDHKKNRITLDYPNHEVKESFTEYIVASLSYVTPVVIGTTSGHLLDALATCDIESFCSTLLALFARIPYTLRIARESYYHSLFHFLMNLLILETHSEILTHIGRIDTAIQTDDYIYIFELKINKSPQEALQQIIDTKYYEGLSLHKKPIILVGLSFMIKKKKDFRIEYVVKKM